MSSDLTSIHAVLAKYLDGMTLPDYKRDTEKPTNVVWLINNLKTKNNGSVHYMQTMLLLCQLAEAKNLLKAKELKSIRASFQKPPIQRRLETKTPSLQQVPKGTFDALPHQIHVIENLPRRAITSWP